MDQQGRYERVLRRPGVLFALFPYALSRLSTTMVLLSILLFGQHQTGSFAIAGAISGAFAAATALVAPMLGRLVDSRGHWPVLASCALVHPLALVALVLCLRNGQTAAAMLAAVVAGAVLPPVTSCMRALWPQLVDDDELMSTAWSIEGLLVEATELGGPLAVGLLVLFVNPVSAVLLAAALSYTGAMLFALSRASMSWRTQRSAGRTGLGRGPLALKGVRALVCIVFVSTAGLAACEVAIAGFASKHGQPGAAGFLFAIWLVGSLAGGWFYGSRAWKRGPHDLLPLLLALCGVTAFAPLLAHSFLTMGLLLALAGLAIAPATAVQFAVMTRVAPDHQRTEAFTWASTASFLGVAAGSWLCGAAVEQSGADVGFVLSAGFGLLAGAIAVLARRDFRDPASVLEAAARSSQRADELALRRERAATQHQTG